jgi:Ca-activated chloride channel family protein
LDHQSVSERDVQAYLGEIPAAGQMLLLELLFPPRQEGSFRLLQTEVTYDDPAQGLSGGKVRADGVVQFSAEPALHEKLDQRVMNLVERVTAHKLQTQALDEAAAGKLAAATQKLRAAATRLLELGEAEMAKAALSEALNLEEGGMLDPAAAQVMRYQTKRLSEGSGENEPEPGASES